MTLMKARCRFILIGVVVTTLHLMVATRYDRGTFAGGATTGTCAMNGNGMDQQPLE